MGFARILDENGAGHYVIELDSGSNLQALLLSRIDALIVDLQERAALAAARLDGVESELAGLASDVDAAIAVYRASLAAGDPSEIAEAQAGLASASGELAAGNKLVGIARMESDAANIELAAAQAQRSAYAAVETAKQIEAWCADLTEGATGTVATIEVPGEPDKVLIAPGARPWMQSDGQLIARALQNPNQVFLNAALLPGWQRHKPTYRIGTIIEIAEDGTCSVELDPVTSSAQGLEINLLEVVEAATVTYMTCGVTVFSVGDRVVVRFSGQSWDNPEVIGFEQEPKGCVVAVAFTAFVDGMGSPGDYDYFFRTTEKDIEEMVLASNIDVYVSNDGGSWQPMVLYESGPLSGGGSFSRYIVAGGIDNYVAGPFFEFGTRKVFSGYIYDSYLQVSHAGFVSDLPQQNALGFKVMAGERTLARFAVDGPRGKVSGAGIDWNEQLQKPEQFQYPFPD